MRETQAASPHEVLHAELSAALPARRSALELERHFMAADQADRVNRGLFQIRVAEARLKSGEGEAMAPVAALATVAVAEAESLEEEAKALVPLLAPLLAGRQIGVLRLVCALFHLARLGEGRARYFLTFARQGKHLLGFEEALELAPENELFFLALRRFRRLLDEKDAWSRLDLEWLRLRSATAPGRLRLRAAALRSAAEAAALTPLPADLQAKRQPFIDRGFESASALAWAVADFSPKEALAWGAAGMPVADQAQAWRDRGFEEEEAATWTALDLLPDEAAAFKACGASDPGMARSLRRVLGDVEHLLVWHRAGFEVAEVLRLQDSGVRSLDEAVQSRKAKDLAKPMQASIQRTPNKTIPAAIKIIPEDEAPAPAPPPFTKQESKSSPLAPVAMEAPTAPWVTIRAEKFFGAGMTADDGSAMVEPKEGGAWLGWGVFEAGAHGSLQSTEQAHTLVKAGGLMDVVAASEGIALLGQPFDPPTISIKGSWQATLDEHRLARGVAALPGQWYLMAWKPLRAWLYWGLAFRSAAVPWGQALDFESHESWQQRWARKTAEFGDDKMQCPVLVGRTAGGGWMVGLKPSVLGAQDGEPSAIKPVIMTPAWRDSMSDFCLKMGIGSKAAAWHLWAGGKENPE